MGILLVFTDDAQALTIQQTFDNWNTHHGLPQTAVIDIEQGPMGFIWVATQSGLARFDGKYFTVFSKETGHLVDNHVTSLAVDGYGRLWIGTQRGLSILNLYTYQYEAFNEALNQELSAAIGLDIQHQFIHALQVDGDDKLWIATDHGTFQYNQQSDDVDLVISNTDLDSRLSSHIVSITTAEDHPVYALSSSGHLYLIKENQIQAISDHDVYPMVKKIRMDPQGRLWLAADFQPLSFIDFNQGQTLTIKNSEQLEVMDLVEDQAGNMIVCTKNNGVKIIDQQLTLHQVVSDDQNHSKSLKSGVYLSAFVDEQDVVWLGSLEHGLFRYNPLANQINHYRDPLQHNNSVYGISEAMNGDIWLGYNGRIDVVQDDNPIQLLQRIIVPARVLVMRQLNATTWLIGTDQGGFKLTLNTYQKPLIERLNHHQSLAVYEILINDNRVYFGTNEGIYLLSDVYRWDQPLRQLMAANAAGNEVDDGHHVLIQQKFSEGLIDAAGRLWFASTNGDLITINETFQQIELVNSLPSDYRHAAEILSFQQLAQEQMLIGTRYGLFLYDLINGQFNPVDSLAFQQAVCGIVTNQASIWLSTMLGVKQLNADTYQLQSKLSKRNGLLDNQCNEFAILQRQNQCIVVGGASGASFFCPEQLTPYVDVDAKLVLTAIELDHMQNLPFNAYQDFSEYGILITDTLRIPDDYQQFSLNFTSIDYYYNDRQYAYRLMGIMDDWVELQTNKVALTHLPNGEYDLQIKSFRPYIEDSVITKTIKIIKSPPIWTSLWGYLFYLCAVIAVIGLMFLAKKSIRHRLTTELTLRLSVQFNTQIDQLLAKNHEILGQNKLLRVSFTKQRRLLAKKDAMLLGIVNEMKTPMTIFNGALQHIRDVLPATKQASLPLDLLETNGERLLSLIKQIISVEKLEKMGSIAFQTIPLSAIIRVVVDYLEPVVKQHKQILNVYLEEEIQIIGDTASIEILISNMIKNAIKNSIAGSIIEIKLTIEQQAAVVCVSDNGYGMDPQLKAHLNTDYHGHTQVDEGIHLGLGLNQCQEIVSLHKGTIDIDSQVGLGTLIRVVLPQASIMKGSGDYVSSLPKLFLPLDEQQPITDFRKPLLLIGDDEPDIVLLLNLQLVENYRLVFANDGQEVLDKVTDCQPDLVILDTYLPRISGIEALRQLRTNEQTKALPVIMFSTDVSAENQIKGFKEGMDLFISKPFDYTILKAKINRLLEKQQLVEKEQAVEEMLDINAASLTNAQILVEREKEFVMQLSEIVQLNYQDPDFTVKTMAAKFAMSEVTFRNKVQQMTHSLPKHYLFNYRCEKAKIKLGLENELPIVEIADACGFKDEGQMRRWFKEFYGYTPSKLRNHKT